MNNRYCLSLCLIIFILSIAGITFPFSFAQIKSSDGILSCDFVNFCSDPVEVKKNFPKSSNAPFSDGLQKPVQTKPGIDEIVPDVTSNISLIATPDLPSNFEDLENPLSRSLHEQVNSSQSMFNNVSIGLTQTQNKTDDIKLNDSKLLSLEQSNTIDESNLATSETSTVNQNTEPVNYLLNISHTSWNNFTSDNGFSLSYPLDWNLTTSDNEVHIESNQLNSRYYPIMSISIRYLDPIILNDTISDLFSIEGVSNESKYSSLLNSKILSNIGLKYYIDLDYIILEPTQTGKYVIDGKQSLSFKVHEFGNTYENEHITVINDDKIYNIEINSDYFPTSDKEAEQFKQIRENILESITWINKTNPITAKPELTQTDNNNTSLNYENIVVIQGDDADNNEIKKSISTSSSILNITSSTHFFDRDNFKIVGEVLNQGSNDLELVKVIVTLYDSDGNVIGTELTYTNPSDVSPQQTAPFEIIIGQGDVSNVSAIKSYKLYLTSDAQVSSNIEENALQDQDSSISSNPEVQPTPISNLTIINPLDKLMNLYNDTSSAIHSNILSNDSWKDSRPNESTSRISTKTIDETVVDVSIVRGASLIGETAYAPNPIKINVGPTIRWTNDDYAFHTVTSGLIGTADAGQLFDSGLVGPTALTTLGKTFEHTFNRAGEYPYFCMLHPSMQGKIIVE